MSQRPTQPGDKHLTASAIILTDSRPTKVLLVHHRKFDAWLQPGGHVEAQENMLEAVIREIREETGLAIAPYLATAQSLDDRAAALPVPDYILEEKIPVHGGEPEHYHLDALYLVRMPEQAVQRALSEHHDIGWFTRDQLADLPMFEHARTLLQELTT